MSDTIMTMDDKRSKIIELVSNGLELDVEEELEKLDTNGFTEDEVVILHDEYLINYIVLDLERFGIKGSKDQEGNVEISIFNTPIKEEAFDAYLALMDLFIDGKFNGDSDWLDNAVANSSDNTALLNSLIDLMIGKSGIITNSTTVEDKVENTIRFSIKGKVLEELYDSELAFESAFEDIIQSLLKIRKCIEEKRGVTLFNGQLEENTTFFDRVETHTASSLSSSLSELVRKILMAGKLLEEEVLDYVFKACYGSEVPLDQVGTEIKNDHVNDRLSAEDIEGFDDLVDSIIETLKECDENNDITANSQGS